MPARSPAAAVAGFKETLQQAVSCITASVLKISPEGYRPGSRPHELTLSGPTTELVRLTTDSAALFFYLRHEYTVDRDPTDGRRWTVHTAAYHYAFDDDEGREILAYHWHPGTEGVPHPHLHIGHGAVRRDAGLNVPVGRNLLRTDLARAHLPTRRIALEEVVRLAIRDLGVRARRADFEAVVLSPNQQAFEQARSWA